MKLYWILIIGAASTWAQADVTTEVQQRNPPLPPVPTNEPGLSHLMRIPPRNIYRTGFQHVEIKVVPPSTTQVPQVTQKPPFTPEEEQLLRGQDPPSAGYSEQNYEVFNSPSDINKGEAGTTAIRHEQINTSEANFGVNSTSETELCPPCDKNEEEGRARIKQEGDQVQLEMEQVIRTEMKDPEGVKMGTPYQANKHTLPRPDNSGIPPLPFTPFRPDIMTPVYMKPLYLRSNGPNAPQWPPIVNSGDRLYIPHIVVENEDSPPEIFPSKVYLVPIPRPLTLGQEDLMSLAYPWEGKTPIPKEELSGPYKPNRPKPHPSFTYPPTFTYLLFPKDLRGK